MKQETQHYGNVLGNGRAEADADMLDEAFLQTSDYASLINTSDFNVVVGRRGTGKSALFRKVGLHYLGQLRTFTVSESQTEELSIALQERLAIIGDDYRLLRAVMRVIWRAYLLFRVAEKVTSFHKNRGTPAADAFESLCKESVFQRVPTGLHFASVVLEGFTTPQGGSALLSVTRTCRIGELEDLVKEMLAGAKGRAVVLLDGLDEGWTPDVFPTAVLGGLVRAASDLRERQTGVHVIAFVRDNMFRALAHLDDDFSRHIEGSDLRLQWTEDALLELVAERIKVAWDLKGESSIKAWNRLAKRELSGREGFRRCLELTLYRPRDIIVLVNRAWRNAGRGGREQIVEADIDAAAADISRERLSDLVKEYRGVMPGIDAFTRLFFGAQAVTSLGSLRRRLDDAVAGIDYSTAEMSDFAVFDSGESVLGALYGVGFLGVRDPTRDSFTFCHDGATRGMADFVDHDLVSIHPCYWHVLEVVKGDAVVSVATTAHDEYTPQGVREAVKDHRIRQLGQTIAQLDSIPMGPEGAHDFEDWVLRACKILFAGYLSNIQAHPTPDGVSRRDIIATVCAETGFWRRICDDYGSRQVVFEVKNYTDLKPEDYRQALAYGGKEYGRITIIVYRSLNEGCNDNERQHILELKAQHEHLVMLLPAYLLKTFVQKVRSPRKKGVYWDDRLAARLDVHVRRYAQVRSGRRAKR